MSDTIPEWALKRACELASTDEAVFDPGFVKKNLWVFPTFAAFARYIAQHEEEPADPLLIEARECVAEALESDDGADGYVEGIRRGDDDYCWQVQGALRALRRGMELAKERDS